MSSRRALCIAVCFSVAWQACLTQSGTLTLSRNVARAGDSIWAQCVVRMCPRSSCVNPDVSLLLNGVRLRPGQPAGSTSELTSSHTTNEIGNSDATKSSASIRPASSGAPGDTTAATSTARDGQADGSETGCHVESANVTAPALQPPGGFVKCSLHCDLHGSRVLNENWVSVGDFPDAPSEPRCEVRGGEMGALSCSWEPGQDSRLSESFQFCYQGVNKDDTNICEDVKGAKSIDLPGNKLDFQKRWKFWVEVHNILGQSSSPTLSLVPMERVTIEAPSVNVTTSPLIPDQAIVTWTAPTGLSIDYTCDLQLAHGDEAPCRTVSNRTLRSQRWEIHDLAPYTNYCARIRCSQPGPQAPNGTWGPEACFDTLPAEPLVGPEMWRLLGPRSSDMLLDLTLLWKRLSAKEARGPVVSYTVRGTAHGKNLRMEVLREPEPQPEPHPVRSLQLGKVPVPSEWCVQATNRVGSSPYSCLRLSVNELPAPTVTEARGSEGGGGVTVRWSPPSSCHHEGCGALEGYVVEWVGSNEDATPPSGHWRRVPAKTTRVTLSEHIKPFTCYSISVVANYGEGEGKSNVVQAYAHHGGPMEQRTLSCEATHKKTAGARGSGRRPTAPACGNATAALTVCTVHGRSLRHGASHLREIHLHLEVKRRPSSVRQTRKEKRKRLRCMSSVDFLLVPSSVRSVPSSAAFIEAVDKMLGLWPHTSVVQPDADSRWPRALRGRNEGCLSGSRPLAPPPHARHCLKVEGEIVPTPANRPLWWQRWQKWLGARCSRQDRSRKCATLCVAQRRVRVEEDRYRRPFNRRPIRSRIQIKFNFCLP